ncbi:MAG TPA: cupin domain-containing protein [Chloroflexota bacterium]|nr:cupin domain-containing protein [Chloroflexota bacterium]
MFLKCGIIKGMLTPERLIELLHLIPLPVEGGYFRQTYLADQLVSRMALPSCYTHDKAFASAIYYLLHDDHVSAMHRLLTDEIYHFYLGDPVEMLLLYPDGSYAVHLLGSDLEAGHQVQFVVPSGVWQGSRILAGGRYALLGTTMAPAYDPSDFELGDRAALIGQYPGIASLITALTH